MKDAAIDFLIMYFMNGEGVCPKQFVVYRSILEVDITNRVYVQCSVLLDNILVM